MKIFYMDKNVCFAKLERKFKLLELCPFKKKSRGRKLRICVHKLSNSNINSNTKTSQDPG